MRVLKSCVSFSTRRFVIVKSLRVLLRNCRVRDEYRRKETAMYFLIPSRKATERNRESERSNFAVINRSLPLGSECVIIL